LRYFEIINPSTAASISASPKTINGALPPNSKDTFLSVLAQARVYMENIVNEIIPAPQSALANGLLFGGDDRLSDELQQKFAVTGMTHIVAVSGYNVSIIVATIMAIAIFVGIRRNWAVFVAIFGIFLFIALIGFPSSGVRAAIMGILVLVAALYGRVSHMYGAILITCAGMLLFNPLLLRYDIGFQLSFLATLGIVAVYPVLEKMFLNRKTSIGILEILLMTIAAQVFVLPVIVYHFHILSVVSLLVNMLVLPILPITMLFVFLMIVVYFIFQPLAIFFGWLAYFLLTYEIRVIDFFVGVRWNSFEIVDINILWFIVYYIMLIGAVVIFSKIKKDEK
jgi:competence protein ComEC